MADCYVDLILGALKLAAFGLLILGSLKKTVIMLDLALFLIPIDFLHLIIISIVFAVKVSVVLAGTAIVVGVLIALIFHIPAWIAIYSFKQELLGVKV